MSPRILVFAAAAVVGVTVSGLGERAERAHRDGRDPFGLFADPTTLLAVNDIQVTLDNLGNIGVPLVNGTQFLRWPKGSPNQYLFNSGLQIAGLIEGDAGPWTGDTVGAFFYDPQGGQATGWPRDEIYVSTNTLDLANWPLEAYVTDAELFPEALLGRKAASQQDSWTKYWDGDPISSVNDVKHPMGIQVTQRSMAWTFPLGNETIIYWILRFKNVTNDPEFQRLNELFYFGDVDLLPDEGWTLRDIYVALGADPDIGINIQDFSTAILPFNLGIAYGGNLAEPTYVYPPDIFFPPFFVTSPGFFGIKYLKSPTDPDTGRQVGLTLVSSTQLSFDGGIDFPDPRGDDQLYRYLSGRFDASQGDPPCNVLPEIDTGDPATTEQSVCFVGQSAIDTRFFQSSGPFALDPGEETTIAVAYLVAPVVERMPDGTPSGLDQNLVTIPAVNSPGFPSFHPGFESARGCDVTGANCRDVIGAAENVVKAVERGAGWVAYNGPAPASSLESIDNRLDQFAVDVVPGSILGRALVAQSIFDNKFLLGFAPEPPPFYLVPGDTQVTIVWEPTPSEAEGDPFADAAADPANRLYNPNYRRFDIEGYRIWRGQGTDIRDLELIAQFDYANTSYIDNTCETILPEETIRGVARVDPFTGDTIDGLTGYSRDEICPFEGGRPFDEGPRQLAIDQFLVFNNGAEGGPPGGGVSRNPDNTNDVVRLDTVIVSDPLLPLDEKIPLQDNGVPFAYVDSDVQNNFTYFYAVTAFDVNSPTSGSISLRSPKLTKTVVPRQLSPDLVEPYSSTTVLIGEDDVPLDASPLNVQPDPDTGIFPGPQPPTPVLRQELSVDPEDISNLVAPGMVTSRIDSIVPETIATGCVQTGGNALGACWMAYMTTESGASAATQSVVEGTTPVWGAFDPDPVAEFPLGTGQAEFDDEALARFGIPAGFGEGLEQVFIGEFGQSIGYSSFEGQANRRQTDLVPGPVAGGSRWFSGDQESVPHPTTFIRVGHLDGIDTVWAPIHHTPRGEGEPQYAESSDMQCFGYTIAFLGRAADVQFTWGSEGFESIQDLTHRVAVPFAASPRASWGFLNTDGNGNGVIDWHDFDYLDAVLESTTAVNLFCEFADNGITDPAKSFLEQIPVVQPTSTNGDDPPLGPLPQTGTGFGLYVNGERYIFELPDGGLPEAGTQWTLRTYSGYLRAQDDLTAAPSDYDLFAGGFEWNIFPTGELRPPLVSGLRFETTIEAAGVVDTGVPDLTLVHTVPDPYRSTSAYDLAPTEKQLMFVNLPSRATLRIYSLSGILVRVLEHDDPSGGGRLVYNLRNRNSQFIASGVYFFHVITPEGYEHVGKFTAIIAGG